MKSAEQFYQEFERAQAALRRAEVLMFLRQETLDILGQPQLYHAFAVVIGHIERRPRE